MRRARCALLVGLALAGCSVVTPEPEPAAPVGGRPAPAPRVQDPPAAAAQVPEVRRVGAEAGPSRTFAEVRGLWVVRTTLTSPQRIRTMVTQAHEAGFNTLLVQVRGRGDAYYASRWEPRAEALTDSSFDPLALVLEEAHARGMAVHAWVNTHLVWSGSRLPASPLHLVNRNPEWLAVPKALARRLAGVDPADPAFAEALRRYAQDNAATVEGMYSSPSHPAVQERVYDVWMDLAERYELDGIHFDYVRYPSADFDFSRGALERFRHWVTPRLPAERVRGLEAAYRTDPLAFAEALPGPWGEFQRTQITGLVERVYHGVKARRPDLQVSAAVFANAGDAYAARFQDWRAWLDRGILDVVVPMAYTPRADLFRSQIREAAVAASRGERVWAGIGAYLNGLSGTLEKLDLAREEGVGGFVLFSYDWAATEGSPNGDGSFLARVGDARLGR